MSDSRILNSLICEIEERGKSLNRADWGVSWGDGPDYAEGD